MQVIQELSRRGTKINAHSTKLGKITMPDIKEIIDEAKQARDEIKLKIHLGSKELQDEWGELEDKWDAFESKAKLGESAEDISEAASLLGEEFVTAFKRIKSAL